MNNKSDKKIGEVNIWVQQDIHYKADGDNKYTHDKVAGPINIGAVEQGAEEVLEYHLKLPPLPPTHQDPYAIAIAYKFYIEVIGVCWLWDSICIPGVLVF